MTSVIRSAKPSLSSRSKMLSTTSRSSAEPLATMLLVRWSVLKRSGTSELSAAAVDGGQVRGAHAGSRRAGVIAEQSCSAVVSWSASPFSIVNTLTSESMPGALIELANQFADQRHAGGRGANDDRVGAGVGGHDRAGQNARVEHSVAIRIDRDDR